jgi:hypothetical protein
MRIASPGDFLLELTNHDLATLNTARGGHRKYPPLAFTEHGAIMAAMVLNADTRKQFDQVYEAILGLMATSRK